MRRYQSGNWFALAGESGIAIVSPSVGSAPLGDLCAALDEGTIGAFIEALARATGSSVTSLPDFGVAVVHDDETRVAVRGSVAASDELTDEPAVTGIGVTGWVEAVWPAAANARLEVAGVDPVGEVLDLWIGTGVALASSLSMREGSDAPSARSPRKPALTREIPSVVAASSAVVQPAQAAPEVPAPPTAPAPTTKAAPAPPASVPIPEDAADDGATIAAPTDEADLLASGGDDGDFGIWGSTIAGPPPAVALISSIPSAAELPPVPSAPPQAPPDASGPGGDSANGTSGPTAVDEVLGDHDGATISVAALRELRSDSAPPTFASVEDLARERRGRAIVSTGAVVNLDRNVIVGRTPKATRITGEMPHLVAVPSPQQDISRNHLEIRVTDTVVVAVDLDTTNGSVLHRQGTEPMRLHPSELTVVVSGDVIDLGDGVTITFEDIP